MQFLNAITIVYVMAGMSICINYMRVIWSTYVGRVLSIVCYVCTSGAYVEVM